MPSIHVQNNTSQTPDARCPACYADAIPVSETQAIYTCRLCGFNSTDISVFEQWRTYTHPALPDQYSISLPNPSSWINKLLRREDKHTSPSYTLNAAEAALEHRGHPIKDFNTSGFLGLPLPMGRWGEKLSFSLSPHLIPAPDTKKRLTIGGICTLKDSDLIAEIILHALDIAEDFIFVVDTAKEKEAATFETLLRDTLQAHKCTDYQLEIAFRALENDFSTQRNIVQNQAKTDWVMQLDTDERLSPELIKAFGWALSKAENTGTLSVGMPRRNFVDGDLTAHYPDLQYRLNRKSVSYTKPVHETPDIAWHQKGHFWLGHIDHSLASERLNVRSKKYEGIAKGAGKPTVLAKLQTPFTLP